MKKLTAIVMAAVLAAAVTACCNNNKPVEEMNRKIRLNVMVTVDPAHLDEVVDGLNLMAAESRKENGCAGYDIYQNTVRPDELIIVETWESQEALDAHAQTPHYTTILPALKDKMQTKLERFEY